MCADSASHGLIDNFGRRIEYLRLSITDRCNLRCSYCMSEEGVTFLSHDAILSYEELERLVDIVTSLGINKIRITGGEPFARKGCIDFLTRLKEEHGVEKLYITSNGVELMPHLFELKKIDISGINLSLDSLDKDRYQKITRRDVLDKVLATFHETLRLGIPLKVNSVIQEGTSDQEIAELSTLVQNNAISLRFIEVMPFSGKKQKIKNSRKKLEERLYNMFPGLYEISSNDIETARRFGVPGAAGTVGIIEGESRTFCATCNKIRITSQGMLKTCLYDNGVLDLRELLRDGSSNEEIAQEIVAKVGRRYEHGNAAEIDNSNQVEESMARVGG